MPLRMWFALPVMEISGDCALIRTLFICLVFNALLWAQSNEDCFMCHSDPDLTKLVDDTLEVSMYVNQEVYENSIHGFFECVDCHMDIEEIPHDEELAEVSCAMCHDGAQEEYNEGIHGIALSNGSEVAATCADCHGVHDILSSDDPKSKTYQGNLAETCGSCHSKPEINMRFGSRGIDRVRLYENSVHGSSLKEDPSGNFATCTDCHGSHKILPPVHPEAMLNVLNISKTCGDCHKTIKEEYHQSIHWNSLLQGNYESPTCTDCHGEHKIKNVRAEENTMAGILRDTEICASCHSSPVMMGRFGLDHRRLESYMKSYHGLAALRGSPEAATCTSCHETHAIRSSTDSLSSVHSTNLVSTCSDCHENVTPAFANIDVHPVDQQSRNPVAYFFRFTYTWLIVIIIGGMVIHNAIIIVHHIREKRRETKYAELVPRFQSWEVYQHGLLFLSFSLLVITGFALKFPEADWVQLLLKIGMTEAVRSNLHRIAAVVMLVISLIQLIYFIFSPKGRKDFKALIPTLEDFGHFKENMAYYLGLSKTRPQFGRYDYTEKAEYLALIWGILVMGITGFVLWFPEFFMSFMPSWFFETSETIHYYEAWLATLAIFFWHWFFVIYHPEKYPMSITWMDGKITLEEFRHHHPKEYENYIKSKEKTIPEKIEDDSEASGE